jgi:hypothetical protein
MQNKKIYPVWTAAFESLSANSPAGVVGDSLTGALLCAIQRADVRG